MTLDWQAPYPGAANVPVRDSLLRHLDALLAQPLPAVPLDGALVAQGAHAPSAASPWRSASTRASSLSAAAQSLPPWRPRDALGAAGVRRVRPRLGQAADRRHPRLLHRRRLPQGAAARACRRRRTRSPRKAGCSGKDAPARSRPPSRCEPCEHDVIALYDGRLRQGVGRAAGRSRRRAAAQPDPGGAGSLYPGLAAIADARPAAGHRRAQLTLSQPPASPPAAAAAAQGGCQGDGGGSDASGGTSRRRLPAARRPARRGRRRRRPARRSTSATRRCATSSATARARRSTWC